MSDPWFVREDSSGTYVVQNHSLIIRSFFEEKQAVEYAKRLNKIKSN